MTEEYRVLDVSVNKDIKLNGSSWEINISPIYPGNPFGGLCASLSLQGLEGPIMLDYQNVCDTNRYARMHFLPGADNKVSFEVKLRRMERWVEAAEIFDSQMRNVSAHPSFEEVEALINSGFLPKLTIVELDTSNETLNIIFTRLGFSLYKRSEYSSPFRAGWDNFVKKAKSGELVNTWKEIYLERQQTKAKLPQV